MIATPEPTIRMPRLLAWLRKLEQQNFHGTVELTFKGKIVYVRKQQGFAPGDRLQ